MCASLSGCGRKGALVWVRVLMHVLLFVGLGVWGKLSVYVRLITGLGDLRSKFLIL